MVLLIDILDKVKDGIISGLDTFFGWFFLALELIGLWLMSILEKILMIFTGEEEVIYNGSRNTLLNIFFSNRSVRGIYAGIAMLGIVFAFVFALVAVIRKVLDLRGKQQGVTLGSILGNLLKSILLIFSMNAIMLVSLTTTDVLIQQVSEAVRNADAVGKSEPIVFSDEDYATMGRIISTLGNYSVNPSYRSRYNLNACYNDIRGDLKILGDRGVFEFTYTDFDADGKKIVTWQSLMVELAKAYDYTKEAPLDNYDDGLTNAILDAMDVLRVNPTLTVLPSYAGQERDSTYTTDVPLDRILFLVGTMGSFIGTGAARNGLYNESPSFTDVVRYPFFSGEESIYNPDAVMEAFYINPVTMNYVVVYLAILGMCTEMIVVILNCGVRIFNLITLYLASPLVISSMPLDDGGKFKQWTTAFVVQLLGVLGMVISIRVFFMVLPVIWSPNLSVDGNVVASYLLTPIVKLILTYCAIVAVSKINGIFNGILADSAGYQAISAGDARGDFMNSRVGRRLDKALETAKTGGLSNLMDPDKREDPKKAEQAEQKKQAKQQQKQQKQQEKNQADLKKLTAGVAYGNATNKNAATGKALKDGELVKMQKAQQYMQQQGMSLDQAQRMAEADYRKEQKADAMWGAKKSTEEQYKNPPPTREQMQSKAKDEAANMTQEQYKDMVAQHQYAKSTGDLPGGKKAKQQDIAQMEATIAAYRARHGGPGQGGEGEVPLPHNENPNLAAQPPENQNRENLAPDAQHQQVEENLAPDAQHQQVEENLAPGGNQAGREVAAGAEEPQVPNAEKDQVHN